MGLSTNHTNHTNGRLAWRGPRSGIARHRRARPSLARHRRSDLFVWFVWFVDSVF